MLMMFGPYNECLLEQIRFWISRAWLCHRHFLCTCTVYSYVPNLNIIFSSINRVYLLPAMSLLGKVRFVLFYFLSSMQSLSSPARYILLGMSRGVGMMEASRLVYKDISVDGPPEIREAFTWFD